MVRSFLRRLALVSNPIMRRAPKALMLAAVASSSLTAAVAPAQTLVQTTSLPVSRAFHGTAVLGDFVYVIGGGTSQGDEDPIPGLTVQGARILPNGSLGAWFNTARIPSPRFYIGASTVTMNDGVYVIGGSSEVLNGDVHPTILWSRADASGQLAPWRESAPFAESQLSCLAAFTTPGFIHITGGVTQKRGISNKVWSAPVAEDGSMGRWREGRPMPKPLWFHSAAVAGGRAYVWGGLLNANSTVPEPSAAVYSAPILSTGVLGEWRLEQTALEQPFYSASSGAAGPYLLSFCPRYQGATVSNDIWWTYVSPTGLQPWRKLPTQLPVKVYHAIGQDYRRGRIYLPGGKPEKGKGTLAQTFVLGLSAAARQQAEQAWAGTQVANKTISTTSLSGVGGGSEAQAAGTSEVPKDFLPLDVARIAAVQHRKPMVMYFHSAVAAPCTEQNKVLAGDLSALKSKAVLAAIDVKQFPQLAHDHGVYRVPSWVVFNSVGVEAGRLTGVQSVEALGKQVAAVR